MDINDNVNIDNWADIMNKKMDMVNVIDTVDTATHKLTVSHTSSNVLSIKSPHTYEISIREKREPNKLSKPLEPFEPLDIEALDNNGEFTSIKTMSDVDLLERSSMLAKNLKFQFNKKCDNDREIFIKWLLASLKYLCESMFELSGRNLQPITVYPITVYPITYDSTPQKQSRMISRTSYKFCEYGHLCKFNYDKDLKCYAQHFVYNMVHHDIVEITNYLMRINLKESETIDVNEIKTSINTITFVINHMYDELTQLAATRVNCYDNYQNRIYRFKTSVGTYMGTNTSTRINAGPPVRTRYQKYKKF